MASTFSGARPMTIGNLEISVVIPTYNRGHLIRRAVESALRQTRPAFEVIVVDDGSTDATQEQMESFGSAVRYVRQTNAGASRARNRGVEEAKTEWIAFLDSDDLWLDTHLERMARAILATNGRAEFYFADMDQTDNEGGGYLWDFCSFRIEGDYAVVEDAADWAMMERQPMMLQTSVFRKSSYLAAGGLWDRLRTRHDTHLFLKLSIGRRVCAVAGCGARQTSDENPDNRLMGAFGPKALEFWLETIPLFEDVLHRVSGLSREHRRTLRTRLAVAHWRAARLLGKDRKVGRSIWEVVRCCISRPATFLSILTNAAATRTALLGGQRSL
jgi:glycosyltransferase involved in cell wall biosynthesis